MTLSFRDQQAGASPISVPMQSDTETRVLTSDWRPYSMTATAPVSPSNPVYSVRVHFEAAAGDTVDLDGISVPEPAAGWLLAAGVLGLFGMTSTHRRSD